MEPEERAARDVERVLAGLPGLAAVVELAVRVLGPEDQATVRRTMNERRPRRPAGGAARGPLIEQAVVRKD